MKEVIRNILQLLFILVLYATAWGNLIASIPNKDIYSLVMAILLYLIATKYEKSALEESEELEENGRE